MALILSGGNGGNATITGNSGNLTVSNAANIFTGSAVVSTTGNITGGNILTAGLISSTGNITGGNILTAGLISSTGNLLVGNSCAVTTSLAVGATTPSGTAGEIRATNSITAYYSDKRLKTNIQTINNALDKVDQLSGITYTQNSLAEQFGYNDYRSQVGVLAQDVQIVLPQAVKLAPFDIDKNGNSVSGENYLTVQYEKLVPLLIQAVKELKQEVESLKEKIKNANSSI